MSPAGFADAMTSGVELGGLMNLKWDRGARAVRDAIEAMSPEDRTRLLMAAVVTLTDPRMDPVWEMWG